MTSHMYCNIVHHLLTGPHIKVWLDYMISKQSVLVINMLDGGEKGRNKDSSYFDKGQIVMARRWVRVSLKCQGVCVAPSQQW